MLLSRIVYPTYPPHANTHTQSVLLPLLQLRTLEEDKQFVIFTLSLTRSSQQVVCLNEDEGWQNRI